MSLTDLFDALAYDPVTVSGPDVAELRLHVQTLYKQASGVERVSTKVLTPMQDAFIECTKLLAQIQAHPQKTDAERVVWAVTSFLHIAQELGIAKNVDPQGVSARVRYLREVEAAWGCVAKKFVGGPVYDPNEPRVIAEHVPRYTGHHDKVMARVDELLALEAEVVALRARVAELDVIEPEATEPAPAPAVPEPAVPEPTSGHAWATKFMAAVTDTVDFRMMASWFAEHEAACFREAHAKKPERAVTEKAPVAPTTTTAQQNIMWLAVDGVLEGIATATTPEPTGLDACTELTQALMAFNVRGQSNTEKLDALFRAWATGYVR